jgi:hypothetical protein
VVLVDDPGNPDSVVRTLPCIPVRPWSKSIGVVGDEWLLLDTSGFAIQAIALDKIRSVSRGELACRPSDDYSRVIPLPRRETPYAGIVFDDSVAVSYFGSNRIELFAWTRSGARLVQELRMPGATGKGMSDLRLIGDTLFAADVGWRCPTGNLCPVLYGDGGLFSVTLSGQTLVAESLRHVPTGQENTSALFEHNSELFVLNTGRVPSGEGSIQRVLGRETLGSALRLGLNSRPAAAVAVDGNHVAVLQLGGDHLFIVDPGRMSLRTVQQFDGERLVRQDPGVKAWPERSDADLVDLWLQPGQPGRFVVVDAKGEQVLYLAFDSARAAFELLGQTALGSVGRRTSPSFAVWLDATR